VQLHDELVYLCLDAIQAEVDHMEVEDGEDAGRAEGAGGAGGVGAGRSTRRTRARAADEEGVLGAYRRCLLRTLRVSNLYR
jgi:hypothetical protein